MARSRCIYLVLIETPAAPGTPHRAIDQHVVAAFTVKHECATFIARSEVPNKGLWVVRRYADGLLGSRVLDGQIVELN